MKRTVAAIGAAAALALAAPPVLAERVRIVAPDGAALVAHWMPRPEGGLSPAVVALHGCGGLFDRTGRAFDPRYPDYVARLHRAGFHVLLPDSFGARGSGPICAVPAAKRTITVEIRRGDALAAVDWLAAHPDVDPRRILMLGWSHGGSTVLSALNADRPSWARNVAGAIVLYPACSAFLKAPFRLQAPVLMLLGEKDDWTSSERCTQLAVRTLQMQPDAQIDVHLYSDSHHGFDSTQPVRFRADIPNGVGGKGVHAGGNPAARAAALREIESFLAARAGSTPNASAPPAPPAAIR